MSQTRLLLLGMLQVQDRHGYELLDAADQQLAAFANLKKASMYYELNRMEAEGLIVARREAQDGRPPRKVYAVTPTGEAAFRRFLREALSQPGTGTTTADMGLMFLDWLPAAEAVQLLTEKVSHLRESLQACRAMVPSHSHGSAVQVTTAHLIARLTFEIDWHQTLIAQLQERIEQA